MRPVIDGPRRGQRHVNLPFALRPDRHWTTRTRTARRRSRARRGRRSRNDRRPVAIVRRGPGVVRWAIRVPSTPSPTASTASTPALMCTRPADDKWRRLRREAESPRRGEVWVLVAAGHEHSRARKSRRRTQSREAEARKLARFTQRYAALPSLRAVAGTTRDVCPLPPPLCSRGEPRTQSIALQRLGDT